MPAFQHSTAFIYSFLWQQKTDVSKHQTEQSEQSKAKTPWSKAHTRTPMYRTHPDPNVPHTPGPGPQCTAHTRTPDPGPQCTAHTRTPGPNVPQGPSILHKPGPRAPMYPGPQFTADPEARCTAQTRTELISQPRQGFAGLMCLTTDNNVAAGVVWRPPESQGAGDRVRTVDNEVQHLSVDTTAAPSPPAMPLIPPAHCPVLS